MMTTDERYMQRCLFLAHKAIGYTYPNPLVGSVIEIDGHNYEEIINALDTAKTVKGKPTVIVANTAKGKGVSFMENNPGFHGMAPNEEEYKKAMEELKED